MAICCATIQSIASGRRHSPPSVATFLKSWPGLAPRAPRHPLPLKVAYHDACHLQHAQGVRAQPRAVLGQIPELQILETAEAALCCGSAGIYNLVRPGPAQELASERSAMFWRPRRILLPREIPAACFSCEAESGSPAARYRWCILWKWWTLRFEDCRHNPCLRRKLRKA
jgi:hypothetical protein